MGTDIREHVNYYRNGAVLSDPKFLPPPGNLPEDGSENPYINTVLGDATRKSVEALLPRYNITEGSESAEVSQARMYFTEPASKSRLEVLEQIPGIDITSGSAYVGFLLSSVSENRSEKVQTMPLHGDNYVATFYGESPRTYSFSGILYNTRNAACRDIFTKLYDYLFRGTAAAKNRTLTQVVYDNRIISGWILNLSQNLSASNEMMVNFGFSMLVRKEVILTPKQALSYNNAYFTGSLSSFDKVEGIDALPAFDDYLNTARIKPPPRPRRASGVRKPNCRVNRAAMRARGGSAAARTAPKAGTFLSSPRASKCDISDSIIQTRRALQDKINRIKSNSSLSAEEKRRRLDLLNNEPEVRDLRAAYRQTEIPGLTAGEKARRDALFQREGFRSIEEVTNFDTKVDTAAATAALRKLNSTVAAGTKTPPADTKSSPSEESSPTPQPKQE